MKKLIFSTLVGSLLALAGCQQNEEIMDNSNTNGEKVTVTANIKGSTNGRVAMVDQEGTSGIKVDWNASGESFTVYGAALDENGNPILTEAIFNQIEGTNQFSGTLPESVEGGYFVYYKMSLALDGEKMNPVFDLSNQDGTLNENNVLMSAYFSLEDESDPIQFEFVHLTFILKPTFKIGEDEVDYTKITKIVVNGIKANANDSSVETVTITPDEQEKENIYIFVPTNQVTNYMPANMNFTFDVTYDGNEYTGELTLKDGLSDLEAGKLYTATIALEEDTPDTTPYVTFSATGAQTFKMTGMNNIPAEGNGTLSYSTDGKNWAVLTAEKGTEGISFGNGTDLRLKGTLTKGTGYSNGTYYNYDFNYKGATISFTTEEKVACTGDIRTLIAEKNYDTATTGEAAFCILFNGCTQLTSAPVLPAKNLATGCYAFMFKGCTSLATAPALNAETLATACYSGMFNGCTSLATAPALNAETLATACYSGMFNGCTSLTTAPALNAETLTESCYQAMFQNCTKLETAPTLPATQLAKSCYDSMFRNCTNLTAAPALNATKLKESCYYAMFANCTSLKTVTSLPATTLANSCYNMMFLECSALTTVPTTLSASTLHPSCYSSMFRDCTSLTTAPTLPATQLAESCYSSMFEGCTKLTKSPELPAATLTDYCYQSMFYGCTNLSEITMLATNISANSCLNMWVYGVAETGTLKKKNTASWTKTQLGLPEGWTITNK